jgi:hypothetical protein
MARCAVFFMMVFLLFGHPTQVLFADWQNVIKCGRQCKGLLCSHPRPFRFLSFRFASLHSLSCGLWCALALLPIALDFASHTAKELM